MIISYIGILIISLLLLVIAGNLLVRSLSRISERLELKQFLVSFFLMSLATASPELIIGISSAVRGASELSLGNIFGQNIVHFTVAIFICVYLLGGFKIRSKTIKATAIFSGLMAIFPLLLIFDGNLSRADGTILIATFVFYAIWLIRKYRRFENVYDSPEMVRKKDLFIKRVLFLFRDLAIFTFGTAILILASQGIVQSGIFFANYFNVSLFLVGVLIIGLGTALPELYFSAISAHNRQSELMAGNLFGSTVVSTSLVLGITSIISPIYNIDIYSFIVSRLFVVIAVIAFVLFMLTDRKISIREGWALLGVYLLFVLIEIFY